MSFENVAYTSITSVTEYEAISNTPGVTESVGGGWKTTRFQETPVMSTYLLAVVISNFSHQELVLENGYEVSVIL